MTIRSRSGLNCLICGTSSPIHVMSSQLSRGASEMEEISVSSSATCMVLLSIGIFGILEVVESNLRKSLARKVLTMPGEAIATQFAWGVWRLGKSGEVIACIRPVLAQGIRSKSPLRRAGHGGQSQVRGAPEGLALDLSATRSGAGPADAGQRRAAAGREDAGGPGDEIMGDAARYQQAKQSEPDNLIIGMMPVSLISSVAEDSEDRLGECGRGGGPPKAAFDS